MTTKIEFYSAGGLFSHYGILLESISEWVRKGIITESDSLYIESLTRAPTNKKSRNRRMTRLEHVGFNVFDSIFDQNIERITRVLTTNQEHPIHPHEFEPKKERYQELSKQFLKIHPDLIKRVESFVSEHFVENKTLGVHVRITDMNRGHKELGNVYFEDFKTKIDEILATNDIEKIFVASDNDESIDKLINIYKDKICYFKSPFRVKLETDDKLKFSSMKQYMSTPNFFKDAMTDALLLSHCDITCGRVSLFNWGSQTFHWSKIKKYYHIEGK